MRKPGTDPDNVQMSDVLCDFCQREWVDDIPMVEGHEGSIVCGRCLTVAYSSVVDAQGDPPQQGGSCRMCLEEREEAGWASPLDPDAFVCRRCIKQAAGRLHKDPDFDWSKPGS